MLYLTASIAVAMHYPGAHVIGVKDSLQLAFVVRVEQPFDSIGVVEVSKGGLVGANSR